MTIARQKGSPRHNFKALLLDLDDTLYRNEEIPKLVREGIERFMVEHLSIHTDEVTSLTTQLYANYGTTLAGLVASGYEVDYNRWHAFVHYELIDYHSMLQPDVLLREILCSTDLPKYVFTNADKIHAEHCLERLGIRDCFQGIFHFENVMEHAERLGLGKQVLCKPQRKAFELVLQHIGLEAHEVVFLDDSTRNIAAAKELGLTTVLVGKDEPVPGADFAIPLAHDLPKILPELFDQPGLVHAALPTVLEGHTAHRHVVQQSRTVAMARTSKDGSTDDARQSLEMEASSVLVAA